jgi:pyruvate dehydrogenase E2 component (dihydrolipoamide acetyltransferase)
VAEVKEVTVPDIGDFTEVPVIEVLVEPGQSVQAEDPLVTLESDKATMDVPAPFGGVVQELRVKVGDSVSQGTLILTLADSADAAAPVEAAAPDAVESAVEAEEASEGAREAAPASQPSPQPSPQPAAAEPPAPTGNGGGPVYASPSVRRLAREQGIDLSTVQGTGRKGRITAEDLRSGGAPAPEAAPAAAAARPAEPAEGDERVPLSRIKKISGPRLQQAWQTIPHVTHFEDADITDLEAFRKRVNGEQDTAKVTMVALLVKACVASLKAFPDFNAQLDGDDLIIKRSYNVGFAADTPQGLMVPVIHDADRKGLLEIAAALTDLSGKARAGKLGPKEMSGGTFTISSLGGLGGTGFTPIINPPQVAILGASKSAMKPVWNGSAFDPRLMLPLSLSYDHRVLDGAAAARFATHLAGVLADMRRVLL